MASDAAKSATPSIYLYPPEIMSASDFPPPGAGRGFLREMGKSKEEDRIEKIIRGLLKLPENRRCINCNCLGPQYVCTTFWTFVCTNCSGVHREFTHRVKSISMAKFSLEEVSALQAGGNERARQIYFKTWDPQRNFFPNNSDIHELRDFIKNVYVGRRYTGESHPALVPRSRKSDRNEPYDHKGTDTSERSGFHERSIDKYSRYSYNETRSLGYLRESSKYGSFKGGSSCFEDTDGRYQVDSARIAGRSATQMFTTEDIKPRRSSPDRHASTDMACPPTVRHMKEILGENFPPLSVGDEPKSSDRRSVDGTLKAQVNRRGDSSAHVQQSGSHSKTIHRRSNSAFVQNAVQSRSETSISSAAVKLKSESTGSLVDFATFPSPDESMERQIQPKHVKNDTGKSASSEPPVNEPAESVPPKNTLEFLLFELGTPAYIPHGSDNAASKGPSSNSTLSHVSPLSTSVSAPAPSSTTMALQDCNFGILESSTHEMVPPLPSGSSDSSHGAGVARSSGAMGFTCVPAASSYVGRPTRTVPDVLRKDGGATNEVAERKQSPSVDQPNLVSDGSSSASQTCHLDGAADNQPQTLSLVPSAEVAFTNSTAKSSQLAQGATQETRTAGKMQPPSADARCSGRTELPADLFASLYPPGPAPIPGWQMGPSYGMGFNMQYHPAPMQIRAFPSVTKSTNPFDSEDNTAEHHATMFPSMASMQGGLSNVSAPTGRLRSSSFGSHLPGFEPTQSPSYPSGAYMGQHLYDNMSSSRLQGNGGFRGEGGMSGPLNSNQHIPYTNPAPPANPSSYRSNGGNPFG